VPRVSVIIPCFNLGLYLSEAVESVLSQTFRDFEIIIVDDESTDLVTQQFPEMYQHPMIHIIRNPYNMGVASSRNIGIRHARGEFILPLDADDVIADTYLEKAIMLLDQRPDVGIVYCDAEFLGEKCGPWELPLYSVTRMLAENLIFSAAFFRRSDWERSGGYCQAMSAGWEDWDFWLTLVASGVQVEKIPDTLFRYRIRLDSRDRSISISNKAALLVNLFFRHFTLYLSYPSSFVHIFRCIGNRFYGA
jgi:glycosyltransferase involved in cell wall biosynthesis